MANGSSARARPRGINGGGAREDEEDSPASPAAPSPPGDRAPSPSGGGAGSGFKRETVIVTVSNPSSARGRGLVATSPRVDSRADSLAKVVSAKSRAPRMSSARSTRTASTMGSPRVSVGSPVSGSSANAPSRSNVTSAVGSRASSRRVCSFTAHSWPASAPSHETETWPARSRRTTHGVASECAGFANPAFSGKVYETVIETAAGSSAGSGSASAGSDADAGGASASTGPSAADAS